MRVSQRLSALAPSAVALCAWLVLLAVVPNQGFAAVLQNADCIKCHQAQPQQISAQGGKHQAAVGCLDCHVGHPPPAVDNIPQCAMCHSGAPHYELPNCALCHVNAHTPLELTLKGELKAECLSCHAPIGDKLNAHPSAHKEVSCNYCHADTHGMIPDCVLCHQPHSQQMTQKDCASCHDAHKPLLVVYDEKLPSVHCAACHDTAMKQIAASPTKHQPLACVFCHQDQHKMVPLCSDCHGVPHAPGIHARFPNCGDCHNIAHDLNNWPSQKKGK